MITISNIKLRHHSILRISKSYIKSKFDSSYKFHTYSNQTSYSTYNFVKVEKKANVLFLTLNDSKTHHSLSSKLLYELKNILSSDMEKCQVLVLKSTGSIFSSGHNLKEISTNNDKETYDLFNLYQEVLNLIADIKPFTVAVIEGDVIAGGLQLIAHVDFAISTNNIKLSCPGSLKIGLYALTPLLSLCYQMSIPPRKALELAINGINITAEEAFYHGFINKVVPKSDINRETDEFVNRLLAVPPEVSYIGKQTYRYILKHNFDVDKIYPYVIKQMLANINNSKTKQNIKAFANKT